MYTPAGSSSVKDAKACRELWECWDDEKGSRAGNTQEGLKGKTKWEALTILDWHKKAKAAAEISYELNQNVCS